MYESSSDEEETTEEDAVEGGSPQLSTGLVDVEDMGRVVGKMKSAKTQRLEVTEFYRSAKLFISCLLKSIRVHLVLSFCTLSWSYCVEFFFTL